MAAFYDSYDYPEFWEGRSYEHEAEVVALNDLMGKIPKIKLLVDVGAGFGRLTPYYLFRAEKVFLTDPSARLLKIARKKYSRRKIKFFQTKLNNLPRKVRPSCADLVILVRVLHHLDNLPETFTVINKILCKNGYFILEFANKNHLKALVSELFRGNLTFSLDIFPKKLKSSKKRKIKGLDIVNFHPDYIFNLLKEQGFSIVEKRSVSNIRSQFLKKYLPLELLLEIEKKLQVLFSKFNWGPSIFVLARKVG
jgi:SAM-dependent methyltransferase